MAHHCYVVGDCQSADEVEHLLAEDVDADDDTPVSPLAAALGILWYDHDFLGTGIWGRIRGRGSRQVI